MISKRKMKARQAQYYTWVRHTLKREITASKGTHWTAGTVVVLRHVHVWVRVADGQRPARAPHLVLCLPPAEVAEDDAFDHAPGERGGQVDVGVDCEEWTCWVKDDGKGMSKDELSVLEDVGRYGKQHR